MDRSRQGVINLAREKRLRAVKTGAGWIYDPKSVEEFAEKKAKEASEKGKGAE